MAATNPIVVNMEVVAKGMPQLWDLDNAMTYGKLKNAVKNNWKITKTPNSHDFRAPMQVSGGGVYAALNPEGGAYPETTGPAFTQMVQTAKSQAIGWDWNLSDEWYTENPALSTHNVMKGIIKDAMKAAKRAANASFFSDGFSGGAQGLIGRISAYDTGVCTMEGEFGANLFWPGMAVEGFDDDLSEHETTGMTTLPKVAYVDPDNDKIKLTDLGSWTPVANDYLAFPGVGATPAWVHGLYYFNKPSASGSILGVSKTTYPQIVPVFENASGAPISKVLMLKIMVKARQKRGGVLPKWTGITHPVVAANWSLEGTEIAQFQRGAGQMPMLDLVPKGATEETATMAGVVHLLDPLASRKRVDWVDFDEFGRVTLKEIGFLKHPGTDSYFWPKRNSSGTPVAATQIWLAWSENFIARDPGRNAVIYGGAGVIA